MSLQCGTGILSRARILHPCPFRCKIATEAKPGPPPFAAFAKTLYILQCWQVKSAAHAIAATGLYAKSVDKGSSPSFEIFYSQHDVFALHFRNMNSVAISQQKKMW